MNKKRVLGFIFIVLAIVIVISNTNITGAVIGTSSSNILSLITLAFLVVGLVLMVYENKAGGIENIVNQFEQGDISSVYAGFELDKIINPQSIRYRTGKQHTWVGERNAYPISLKSGKKAKELAMMGYIIAGINNPKEASKSNIEIKKGVSTKDYMKGFQKALEKYKIAHLSELKSLGIVT